MSLDPRCGVVEHACHDEPGRKLIRKDRLMTRPFVNRRTRVGPASKTMGLRQQNYLAGRYG